MDLDRKDAYFGKKATLELAQGWKSDFDCAGSLDDESAQLLYDATYKFAGLAQERALMAARDSFMSWTKRQWKLKPRLAHAH
eukprot:3603687-Pyramimonas_sp.AAC.1